MFISSSAHDNSAPATYFLDLFPETLPLEERVNGVLKNPVRPGVVGRSVVSFLQMVTLQLHWDRNSVEQTLRLQRMITTAICDDYQYWEAFRADLKPYLEEFCFAATFIDDADHPMVAQAESENPRN